MSSLAERARAAVDARPFLRTALRAGVVNYAAAARFVDVDGDPDAVATALRRYAEELPAFEAADRRASVAMRSGLAETDDATNAVLAVNGTQYAVNGGDLTGLVATGDVDAAALSTALDRLAAADVSPAAAGVAGDSLVVVVPRRAGANAVRVVEDALDAVPE